MNKSVAAYAVALLASAMIAVASTLVVARWPFDRSPPIQRDFVVTLVEAPTNVLPLRRVRLLTKRLVLLAAAKAEVYWGGTYCKTITFNFRQLADRRIAEAKWAAYPNSKEYLDCYVTFNTDPTRIRTTFWHYCSAVIHEFGHLSGHVHIANPRGIMHATLSNTNVPETCKRLVYP